MKKLTILFLCTSIVGSLFISSCNKKLKEEIKEMDADLEKLKSQNESMSSQIDHQSSLLGSNEPITFTTSFLDDNNTTQTFSDTYSLKSSNYSTQYMQENPDGTYDIYIERLSDVEWENYVWVDFVYNPATGAITGKRGGADWDWNLSYNSRASYNESYAGCTINIVLSNINTSTGDISLTFTGTGDANYAANAGTPGTLLPNNDKGATTTFSFTGKLKVYPLD